MQVLIQIDLDLKEGKHNYMSPPDTGAPVNFEVQTPPYGRILSSLGTNKLKFKPILLDHHIGFLFLKKRRSYVSQKKKGHFDPCHYNFSKLDLMLKIMPLSGMILNVTPNFTELWWHESNFPNF